MDGGPDRLMDAVPYLMCLCTAGRITFINSAGARMLGAAAAAEVLGHWFTDYVESDYAAILGEEIISDDLTDIDIPVKL